MCTSTARSLLTAALVATAFAQLSAQTAGVVAVGERVRIKAGSGEQSAWHKGTVLSASLDSITLQDGTSKPPRTVAVASITDVGVSRGRLSNSWRGMGYGFLAGAGAGALVGVATYKKERGDCSFFYCTPDYRPRDGISPAAGARLGATLGLIVGGIGGRFYRTEKWRRRAVAAGTRVTLDAPYSGGGTLVVSVQAPLIFGGY